MIRETEVTTSTPLPKHMEGMAMKHVINEDLIFHRHQRMKKLPEVVCEFTKDKDLIHQYFVLRAIHLSKVLPIPMSPEPDEYDKRAEILVVRYGRQVVGGARVIPRLNLNEPPLYIERGGFLMNEVLPELELDKHSYAELSKLFLLEEFQNSSVVNMIYQSILEHCLARGFDYAFSTSSPEAARAHKRALLGTPTKATTLSHITVPIDGPERSDNTSFQVLSLFTFKKDLPAAKVKEQKALLHA